MSSEPTLRPKSVRIIPTGVFKSGRYYYYYFRYFNELLDVMEKGEWHAMKF